MTAERVSVRRVRRNRPIFSRLGLLLLIGLCVLFVSSYAHRLLRLAEVEREIDVWEQRIAEAELHQQELQAELDFVNSPAYVEDVARNQLDMARDGDTVIILLRSETQPVFSEGVERTDAEAVITTSEMHEPATWRQWIDLLSGDD